MSELSRLKMRCRRGMKELDVVFGVYLAHHYPNANEHEKQMLNELLDMHDPLLFGMVLGLDPVPAQYEDLIQKLRQVHG